MVIYIFDFSTYFENKKSHDRLIFQANPVYKNKRVKGTSLD